MKIVENQQRITLLPIILRYCFPPAMVFEDEAKVYDCLPKYEFNLLRVKHKKEYVTREGVNTNSIESLWSNLKYVNKRMSGTTEDQMPGHLDEFMYRRNRDSKCDIYETFISDITEFYPV